jgi:hypothetical protein
VGVGFEAGLDRSIDRSSRSKVTACVHSRASSEREQQSTCLQRRCSAVRSSRRQPGQEGQKGCAQPAGRGWRGRGRNISVWEGGGGRDVGKIFGLAFLGNGWECEAGAVGAFATYRNRERFGYDTSKAGPYLPPFIDSNQRLGGGGGWWKNREPKTPQTI